MERQIILQNYLNTYYPYLNNKRIIYILTIIQELSETNKLSNKYYPELLSEVDTSIQIRRDPIININQNNNIKKSIQDLFNTIDKNKKGFLSPKNVLKLYKNKHNLIISDGQMSDLISVLYTTGKINFDTFMNIMSDY